MSQYGPWLTKSVFRSYRENEVMKNAWYYKVVMAPGWSKLYGCRPLTQQRKMTLWPAAGDLDRLFHASQNMASLDSMVSTLLYRRSHSVPLTKKS